MLIISGDTVCECFRRVIIRQYQPVTVNQRISSSGKASANHSLSAVGTKLFITP